MEIFKSIDERFEEIGFAKTSENEYGAYYEKYHEKYGYTQVLAICHKASGKHLIQSYQKDCNAEGYNHSVGISLYEAKLAMKKAKKMRYKTLRIK